MDCLDAILSREAQPAATLRETVRRVLTTARLAHVEDEVLRRLDRRDDAAACWIRAALLEARAEWAEAAALYAKVVDPAGREVPDALFQRARIAARGGDNPQAASLLRFALRMQPGYPLILRSEALVRRLRGCPPARHKVRVALVGSVTTSLIKSTLESLFFRDGIEAAFYEAPFGGFHQEILDDNSGLYRFAPNFAVFLVNWRDCGIGFFTEDPESAAENCARQFTSLWEKLLARCPCQIVQPAFLPPQEDPLVGLASLLPQGRARVLREVNRRLFEAAPAAVTMLDTERISAQHPGPWEDRLKWSSAKIHPAPDALPVLAEHIVSCVRASLGLSAKVLALDLDNTLWGGIIGEDGLGGIALGAPSAIGERFQDFQRYVKALKERGILLAVVSKNNPADAEAVFRSHDSSVLKMDDFVAFEANWAPKHENLRKIASRLGLGLDSFVFLDDNPVERATIRNALAEVIVPEISAEPSDSLAALERGLYFQALSLTEEDKARSGSYVARARMEGALSGESDLNAYLLSLDMELSWGPVDESNCVRATQLINKTNQFTLTTRRYTQEQVAGFSRSPKHWLRWFRLRDRFADHGLIAILLATTLEDATWSVDSWLMSCRVIGRGVEEFMFNRLVDTARREGARTISAQYIPTPKNGLVENLLPRLGFAPGPAEGAFHLDLAQARLFPCVGLREAEKAGI